MRRRVLWEGETYNIRRRLGVEIVTLSAVSLGVHIAYAGLRVACASVVALVDCLAHHPIAEIDSVAEA